MGTKFWIGVVSQAHVERGVSGGFAQLCHGKAAPLRRMKQGDWLIYYAPKTAMAEGCSLQMFTAIGKVIGEAPYSYEMTPEFTPYRLDISYVPCKPASIHPLLAELSFIHDPKRWGYPFRYGHLEITREDFNRIAHAMDVHFAEKP